MEGKRERAEKVAKERGDRRKRKITRETEVRQNRTDTDRRGRGR